MNQALSGAARSGATGSAADQDRFDGRSGRVAVTMHRAPDGRSYIGHQYATYPFHICRPHYVSGDPVGMATLYLQSIAGGLFEHDRLAMEVSVKECAALHLTSQGATIVHAMTGGRAILTTTLSAAPGAIVEILPEATILFPGAQLDYRTVIRADDSAIVCVGESVIAHDPQGRDTPFGGFVSDIRFQTPDGRVLAHDRQAADGATFQALSRDTSGGLGTYGGIHVWAPRHDLDRLASRLAVDLPDLRNAYAGVSRLPHDCGLTVRILAADGAALRAAWQAAWLAVRRDLLSAPAPRRRK